MIGETTGEGYSPDAAFVAGLTGGNVLFGEPLAPFSLSRKIAAQQMGCMAPTLAPDAMESFRRGMIYPGVLNDVIITLWLCTLRDEIASVEEHRAGAFTPDRAIGQPGEANAQARRWAESVGITGLETGPFFEGWKVFLTIMFGIDASLFDIKEDVASGQPQRDHAPPKTKPGHPKSRSASRRSHGSAGKPSGSSGGKCPTPKPSTTG